MKIAAATAADQAACESAQALLPSPWSQTATLIECDNDGLRVTIPWTIAGSDDVADTIRQTIARETRRIIPVSIVVVAGAKGRWNQKRIYNPVDIEVGDVLAIRHEPWLVQDARPATLDEITADGRWAGDSLEAMVGQVWRLSLIGVWNEVPDAAVLVTVGQIREFIERLDPSGRWAECSDCGKLWPCPDELAASAAALDAMRAARACAHCDRPVNAGQMKVEFPATEPDDDPKVFHGRHGSCLNAANRYAATVGVTVKRGIGDRWDVVSVAEDV